MDASSPAWDLFTAAGMVVAITGGGTGLGLMMAKALEANGAKKVYIIGRRWEKLEAAAKQAKHGKISPLPGDVTSIESMRHCVEYIRAREGYVNVLITSAGKMVPKQFTDVSGFDTVEKWSEHFLSIPMEDFTSTFNLNVSASFYTAMAFLPLLDAGNKDKTYTSLSQVIAMGSVGGNLRRMGAAMGYGVSKAAVRQLAMDCATQFCPFNIRFNVIALGGYRSEFTEQHPLFQKQNPRAEDDGGMPTTLAPTGRAGREYNCAGAVLYLTSPAGDYCNGSIMLADGGLATQVPATW